MTKAFSPLLLIGSVTLACALLGCGGGVSNATPEGAVSGTIQSLRNNDLKALFEHSVAPADQAEARSAFAAKMAEPARDDEKAQFNSKMTQLTADGAEDTVYLLIKPQLAKAQGSLTGAVGMLSMMAMSVVPSEGMSEDEQKEMQAMLAGVGEWAGKVDLTDEAKAKQAVGVVCATARDLKVPNYDALTALSFDDALVKGGQVMAGLKKVLKIYSFDIDAVLDSAKVGAPVVTGTSASVPLSLTVFGNTSTGDVNLEQVAGKWFAAAPAADAPAME
ncbi:MAG: hypothetical protein PF961_13420 [Planctomycetota bacterium]|jgi:hypothetical protein|nr:hypothetical protein [Planctomycetota bacterium]